ncbi:hypothetical protein SLA2020_437630 [Shorea laevis]
MGKNSKDDGTAHAPYKDDQLKEENWVDSTIGLTSSGRGRGGRGRGRGRTRGGRSERRVIRSRAEPRKEVQPLTVTDLGRYWDGKGDHVDEEGVGEVVGALEAGRDLQRWLWLIEKKRAPKR